MKEKDNIVMCFVCGLTAWTCNCGTMWGGAE